MGSIRLLAGPLLAVILTILTVSWHNPVSNLSESFLPAPSKARQAGSQADGPRIDGLSVGKRYVYAGGEVKERIIEVGERLAVVQLDFTPVDVAGGRVIIESELVPLRTPWLDVTRQRIDYQPGIGWRHWLIEIDEDRAPYRWRVSIASPGTEPNHTLVFYVTRGGD